MKEVSELMPLLATRGLVVFPHMLIHFDIGREKAVKALEDAMTRDRPVFLVAQKDARDEDPGTDEMYKTGTVSRIRQVLKLPNETVRVLVEGEYRAAIKSVASEIPFVMAGVIPRPDKRPRISATRSAALMRYTLELFEEYVEMATRIMPESVLNAREITDMGHLGDYIAQSLAIRIPERQELLEETNIVARLERIDVIIQRELEVLQVEHEIHLKLHGKVIKNQRDYYLREQLRTIQEELGDEENPQSESNEYYEKVVKLGLPTEPREKLVREVKRLGKTSPHSPEYGLLRDYLDTALELPWNKLSPDRPDMAKAERILEREHYGLAKVKERVMEFLAVKRLAPGLKGQIICLVGPPGVGKTSIAASIAHACGRKLGRLSLGGVRDEADIRGHRKTYVGAMPGRVLTAIKQAGTRNPVLLLDEVDKMGHDFRGDPAAALLEVLDSEQNHSFRDHYLEMPFDLSEVLFVTTANTLETVPRPLLDRMEIIELTSYTDEEKLQIAKRHLLPRELKRHGLKARQLKITDNAVREIISGYTRESGVRKLEQKLAAVCRKAARRITDGETAIKITPAELEDTLGTKRFKSEKRGADTVGLANGLAWTQAGGELLQVEAGVMDGTGKIELTGNLGDVMKESAKAAITYIRSRVDTLHIEPEFYKNKDIHIHFPESAVPKDGPSAGITMAVAMASALTGNAVRGDVAMTGEITLRGRVLPIGGLKEKTMAALRYGVKTVIIPSDNERDLDDIDPIVRRALTFKVAENMDAVLEATLITIDN